MTCGLVGRAILSRMVISLSSMIGLTLFMSWVLPWVGSSDDSSVSCVLGGVFAADESTGIGGDSSLS